MGDSNAPSHSGCSRARARTRGHSPAGPPSPDPRTDHAFTNRWSHPPFPEPPQFENIFYTPPEVTDKEGKMGREIILRANYFRLTLPFNWSIRKSLLALKLQEMGPHFFDPDAAIMLPEKKLELWPGYITSMRTHEHGKLLLCVDTTHNVLKIIRAIEKTGDFRDDDGARNAAILKDLKDTVVMTTYNRKTYIVDDIDFKLSPNSTFDCSGRSVSYAEYYKEKYGVTITDLEQPLIVARPSKKDKFKLSSRSWTWNGELEKIMLVPELCRSTYLTELAKYLDQMPNDKVKAIEEFGRRLRSNEIIRIDFGNRGLEFDDKLMELIGRVLPRESILFAKGTQPVDSRGDFATAFISQQMLSAVQLTDWAILVPQDAAGFGVEYLTRALVKCAAVLGMRIAYPKNILNLPNTEGQTYRRSLEEVVKRQPNIQMIFVILPHNKPDLYASVKKHLAVELGIPSQCFLSKNVDCKGLMSIATKVVIQMNAKLGGEPWSVELPLRNTMLIGFDVYKREEEAGGGTIGAMVATFSPKFNKFFSTTSTYNDAGGKLSRNIQADVKKCLVAYQEENNGELPEKIFMYRDGVGEGQLKMIHEVEVTLIKEELSKVYSSKGLSARGLTYIVVSRRSNTRLFEIKGPSHDNPPPGTVVDTVVTLPERNDFYLVSDHARQGTVTPSYYNVLCNESGLAVDKIQVITYKLCHMYFNWSGTITVPAPCQYARKLAFMTGTAYAGESNEKLSKLLHFL